MYWILFLLSTVMPLNRLILLLDPQLWPEASCLWIRSVHCSVWNFSWNWLFSFSGTQHGVRSPCQGFQNGVNLWGDNTGRMTKNCMNITKSTCLRQISGRYKPLFWLVGGIPSVPFLLRETLHVVLCMTEPDFFKK